MAILNILIGCGVFFLLVFVNNFFLMHHDHLALLSALAAMLPLWIWLRISYFFLQKSHPEAVSFIFSKKVMIAAGMAGALAVAYFFSSSSPIVVEPDIAILIGAGQTLVAFFGFGLGMVVGLVFSGKK
jgi:uncharacterized membrane protein